MEASQRTARLIRARYIVGVLIVVVAAVAATAAPLEVYAVSLAVFGIPHVLAELRYVDLRFRSRIGRREVIGIVTLLSLLAAGRAAAVADLPFTRYGGSIELVILAALSLVTIPLLVRASQTGTFVAILVAGAVSAGAIMFPTSTLVIVALLHNLTPIGFLAERLEGRFRISAMMACAFAFVVIPIVMISGVVEPLFSLGMSTWFDVSPWTGPLFDHLPAFVPREVLREPWAPRLFSAAAYMQVLHYVVVLGVLPRLIADGSQDTNANHVSPKSLCPWPSTSTFTWILIVSAGLGAMGFASSFVEARSAYAIAASVHAFVEFPVLLLAIAPRARLVDLATA